jgi:hypothetical protein
MASSRTGSVLSESATACSASEGRKVGDLVWGLAHLEVDGLSCDPTVGLRSADVETTGTKLCECSTATMSSRPFPHWVRTHCQLGQTPAGGQVPGTRRPGSGVPVRPVGDRPLRPRSHSPMPVLPDRRMALGLVVVPGSSAPSVGRAQAQQPVQAVEQSAPGATATQKPGKPPACRQARVVTGGTPRVRAGAPARTAAAARPLPRCDPYLGAS